MTIEVFDQQLVMRITTEDNPLGALASMSGVAIGTLPQGFVLDDGQLVSPAGVGTSLTGFSVTMANPVATVYSSASTDGDAVRLGTGALGAVAGTGASGTGGATLTLNNLTATAFPAFASGAGNVTLLLRGHFEY